MRNKRENTLAILKFLSIGFIAFCVILAVCDEISKN